ncbi:MAG: helix-turn-helix domain-containing protein [Bacteroidaceae bacterium]|nr:helix-turn-helix domain-containing protein [Bacteroidaceae bacterium]
MDIIAQIPIQLILFFILYVVTGVVPLLAALYLWFYRGNAIAPGVTPPVRLRRWAASFFSVAVLGHVWWLVFYIYYGDALSMDNLIHSAGYWAIVILEYVTQLTTLAGTLLSMLQDRRRPVWPVLVVMLPIVALGGALMVSPDMLLMQIAFAYVVLLYVLFTVYMVFAVRRYGRWLNDNYADLENKKVWLSQTVTLGCLLLFVLLLWRVETLPQLDAPSADETYTPPALERQVSTATSESAFVPDTMPISSTQAEQPSANPINIDVDQIEQLLKDYCVAPQLYLEKELTLQMLAQAVGTNRYYLSQYFSRQSITYNIYINNLRINHFISRCQELAAAGQNIPIQQLALESGFRSYRTFSRAFLLRTGQSVTEWLNGDGDI